MEKEMTIQETIVQIIIETIGNLISNLAYILIFIWGVKFLSKEMGKGIQKIPHWLEQYEQITKQKRAIDNALSKRQI